MSRPMTNSRRWRGLRARGREHGSGGGAALEVLIVAPVFILILLLCIAGGRYVLGSGKVDQAAAAAARAASLTPTAQEAQAAARTQANQSLSDAGITCQDLDVSVDTTGFDLPPGTPGSVKVTVTCTVALGDLSIPGVPGSHTVHATAASPIDIRQEGRS